MIKGSARYANGMCKMQSRDVERGELSFQLGVHDRHLNTHKSLKKIAVPQACRCPQRRNESQPTIRSDNGV